jgi:hypothetical protein
VARIFIDVHQDGTFTTGPFHGCPKAHAANQDGGVITYMSDDVVFRDIEPFGIVFRRHTIAAKLAFGPLGRWSGDWRKWGAFCINKWGAWFERVECGARRARLPSADDKIDQRALGIITRARKILLSVLRNRMRDESPESIRRAITRLSESGAISVISDCEGSGVTVILVN